MSTLLRWMIFIVVALGLLAPSGWAQVKRTTLEKRLIRTAESFNYVVSSDSSRIPPSILARAQGILIFRHYEAGFVFGAKGGYGIALARSRDGRWSRPAFLKSAEGSFGFQIGAQRSDVVFLFMNDRAMEVFREAKFRIGVDMAAAAGPLGANAEGKIGAPILVYSSNAGLYAGAKFEGGALIPDEEANDSFYGVSGISVPDILYRNWSDPYPPSAEGLRMTIERYEAPARPAKRQNNNPWWQPRNPSL